MKERKKRNPPHSKGPSDPWHFTDKPPNKHWPELQQRLRGTRLENHFCFPREPHAQKAVDGVVLPRLGAENVNIRFRG